MSYVDKESNVYLAAYKEQSLPMVILPWLLDLQKDRSIVTSPPKRQI
jgi:hypothetical protein